MSFDYNCITSSPLGIKTVYVDRVVKEIVEKPFEPKIGLKAAMVGNGGTVYTQVVSLPKGRIGVANVGDKQVRVRVELTPGSYLNEYELGTNFKFQGYTQGLRYYSGIFECCKTTDAVIRASRALSL